MDILKKLYIEPSSCCNLRCSMCFRNSWFDETTGVMSDYVWDKVLDGIKKSQNDLSVMFAGMGEPLTHPKIFDMVKAVTKSGKRSELLTNASLLSEEFGKKLVDGGLNKLWVSVDAFNRDGYEKIQKGSQFDLITKNIEYFSKIKNKCSLGITFVVMQENIEELPKINSFADRFGVDEINLSYAVPSQSLKCEESVYDKEIPMGKMPRFNAEQKVKRELNLCPFINEGKCFVKWNGEICPCMQLLHSSYTYLYEEKRKVTFKSFGNVLQKELLDIWASTEYSEFRRRVNDFEFPDCTLCDGCDDRLNNEKDCMYNTFPTCGACLWAQGVGRCP